MIVLQTVLLLPQFSPNHFQLCVREEVRRRTQGLWYRNDEAIADYLVGLRHRINYVSRSYSLEDFTYANLHPNCSKIERDQVRSLEDLEAKREHLEYNLE